MLYLPRNCPMMSSVSNHAGKLLLLLVDFWPGATTIGTSAMVADLLRGIIMTSKVPFHGPMAVGICITVPWQLTSVSGRETS